MIRIEENIFISMNFKWEPFLSYKKKKKLWKNYIVTNLLAESNREWLLNTK